MSQSPDRRQCPGCGTALGDADRFCWKCGAGMRQSFPASRAGARPSAIGSALLVLLAVALALAGSAMTCNSLSGGTPVPGLLLQLAAAGVCVFAGWQMAARS